MRLFICLLIMLAIGLSLQGCGRKGPLTMPVANNAAAPAAIQSMPLAASAIPVTPTVK
jgi:predicted small lipoprotein YifL